MRRLMLVALFLAACNSPAPPLTAPPSSAIPTLAPTTLPTETPFAGTGVISFGRNYDRGTGAIEVQKSTFSRTVDRIAYSASFSEEPSTTKSVRRAHLVSWSPTCTQFCTQFRCIPTDGVDPVTHDGRLRGTIKRDSDETRLTGRAR